MCRASREAAAAPGAPNAAWLAGAAGPLELGAAAPAPAHRAGDALEVRCEEDGQWYRAVVESEQSHGRPRVCYHKDGYEYRCPLGIWRVPKRCSPCDVVEVRCKDDGKWYQAVVESEAGDGPARVRFEKDGYAYHYPLADWRVRRAPLEQEGAKAREPPLAKRALGDLKEGQAVRGRVANVTEFGFFADIGVVGHNGLVHRSRIPGDVPQVSDIVSLGDELDLWVYHINKDGVSLTMLDPSSGLADVSAFQGFPPDQWLLGVVREVEEFGAFVDVPAPGGGQVVKGLVAVSELKHGRVKSPRDVVASGDEVRVRVLSATPGKLALSLKSLASPSDAFARFKGQDEWFQGVVEDIEPYGAFVAVHVPADGGTYTGMVHVSDLRDGYVPTVEDAVSVGQEVAVRVLDVRDGRLTFSMRPMAVPDSSAFAAFGDVPADQWLPGLVRRMTDFGAFVEVQAPGGGLASVGLLHKSQMSQDFVESPEDVVSIGQEVNVRVLSVNASTGLLYLSMTNGTGISSAFGDIPADRWLPGIVRRIADFGAFVQVQPPGGGPACTGLVHVSQMSHDHVENTHDIVSVGQELPVRVLEAADRLILSMRGENRTSELSAFQGFPTDQWIPGVVRRLTDFGAFVDVRPPTGGASCRGLVHKSEMTDDLSARPQDAASVGQEVVVRVRGVEAGRLLLSMRPEAGAGPGRPEPAAAGGIVDLDD